MNCLDQLQKQIHFYIHDQSCNYESTLEQMRAYAFGCSRVSNTSDYNLEDKEKELHHLLDVDTNPEQTCLAKGIANCEALPIVWKCG